MARRTKDPVVPEKHLTGLALKRAASKRRYWAVVSKRTGIVTATARTRQLARMHRDDLFDAQSWTVRQIAVVIGGTR
jgi:hypothetical protein